MKLPLTPAEKQKRYREALKDKLAAAQDQSEPHLRQSLTAYVRSDTDRIESVDWCQQEVGIDLDYLIQGPEHDRDLELTENLVGALLLVAEVLASLLSEYKRSQIEKALARAAKRISQHQSDAATQIEELIQIRGRLKKKFRREFQEYQAKSF